jgi:hypothetical protein
VHKAIADAGLSDGAYTVVRIGNLMDDGRLKYMHSDFEKKLFPGSVTLSDLSDVGTVCFKRAVLVPDAYASGTRFTKY